MNLTIYLKPLSLYIQLGDHFSSEIKHYSRKLREKAQRNSDQIMLGHRQLALSRYHYQKLTFRQAIACAVNALSHFSSSNDRDDIVDSLSHLAIYEVEKGDLISASGHVKEARAIFDEIHCEYLRPYLLLAEGAVTRAEGDAAAEGILENALATSRKMGTREITWQIQRQLALLFLDSGDIQASAAFYRDSIESIKQITESIPDEGIKMSYLSLPFRKRVFDEIKALRSK
jgi:tetratricopeptide (TPR) repeat protein